MGSVKKRGGMVLIELTKIFLLNILTKSFLSKKWVCTKVGETKLHTFNIYCISKPKLVTFSISATPALHLHE